MFNILHLPKTILATVAIALILLAACGSDGEPSSIPISPLQPVSPLQGPLAADNPYTANPPTLPASQENLGTVVGRLISSKTNLPLNREIVRLGEVECGEDVPPEEKRSKCVWTISNAFSPSTFTDEQGFFVFNDVPPRDYVVSIGDLMVYNGHIRVADENGPFMWTVSADEVVDIGEHYVEW